MADQPPSDGAIVNVVLTALFTAIATLAGALGWIGKNAFARIEQLNNEKNELNEQLTSAEARAAAAEAKLEKRGEGNT